MTKNLHATGIYVNEKSYAFWGTQLKEQNRDCIATIEPDLWKNLFNTAVAPFAEENREKQVLVASATAARIQYGFALETLFALLFAAIQAPHCVIGWLQHYRLRDIDSLIDKINSRTQIPVGVNLSEISWTSISERIHCNFTMDDKKVEQETKEYFVKALKRFSDELLDEGKRCEFNSLKHSMRVRAGGFGMSVSPASAEGEIPREIAFGYCEYGSTYYKSIDIPSMKKNQRRLETRMYNWNVEYIKECMETIRILIYNIKTFLMGFNGILEGKDVIYLYPKDLNALNASLKKNNYPISSTIREEIDFDGIKELSNDQIVTIYQQLSCAK